MQHGTELRGSKAKVNFIFFLKAQEVEVIGASCFAMLMVFLQYYHIGFVAETFENFKPLSGSGLIPSPEKLPRTDVLLQAHEVKLAVQTNKRRIQQKGEHSTLGTSTENNHTFPVLPLRFEVRYCIHPSC